MCYKIIIAVSADLSCRWWQQTEGHPGMQLRPSDTPSHSAGWNFTPGGNAGIWYASVRTGAEGMPCAAKYTQNQPTDVRNG